MRRQRGRISRRGNILGDGKMEFWKDGIMEFWKMQKAQIPANLSFLNDGVAKV